MLGFELTPEQLDIRQRARDFALQEILPIAWVHDERDDMPLPVLMKAFDAGIISADIPKEYGGRGYGLLDTILMVEELSAACAGIATSVFDNSLGLAPLILSRNEPLRKEYLQELAKQINFACFATSEPLLGSDVSGIRCRAEEQENGYVLNGTKYWITNGGIADYISVFATTDPEKGYAGIGGFLVHLDWAGVTRSKHIPKMGQRASNTVGIHFKDVFVPEKNILAPPWERFYPGHENLYPDPPGNRSLRGRSCQVCHGIRHRLRKKASCLRNAAQQLPEHPVQTGGDVSEG
jgi:acyl-CoA dehydrogenase